jgi:protein TonB
MFEDFCPSSTARASRARFGRSMAAAVLIYGSAGAAIVGATATAHKVAAETERQVQFAPYPEPPPPPPPTPQLAAPKASPRPKVKRPELAAPDKISDEKPKESDKPLASSSESGPVDGFLDGVLGGTGTGSPPPPAPTPTALPQPKPEPLVPPADAGRNEKPKYSAAARRKGVEGTVVVAFDVLEDGSVTSPQILRGPLELQESVLRTVVSWHFVPAHRGTQKVRFRMTTSISFHLEEG